MSPEAKRRKDHINRTYAILKDSSLTCLEKINAVYEEIRIFEFDK